MNFQELNFSSPSPQQLNSSSAKRKFVDDSEQIVNAKRLHSSLENTACQLELQQLMPGITNYIPSSNAIANLANQNLSTNSASCGMLTPPTEQQQQPPLPPREQLDYDCTMMMIDDEYTDEDESLQTPSYMNYYSNYDSTDDLENGGYTGQLER